jgi:hypothetical protein
MAKGLGGYLSISIVGNNNLKVVLTIGREGIITYYREGVITIGREGVFNSRL